MVCITCLNYSVLTTTDCCWSGLQCTLCYLPTKRANKQIFKERINSPRMASISGNLQATTTLHTIHRFILYVVATG